jgi:hypothetical protein
MADAACSANSALSILVGSRTRALDHFVAISSCGAYGDPQNDISKLSTLLAVQGGYKLVVYGVNKDGRVLPTPIPRADFWDWPLYHHDQLFAVVLGPGSTLCVCSSSFNR